MPQAERERENMEKNFNYICKTFLLLYLVVVNNKQNIQTHVAY